MQQFSFLKLGLTPVCFFGLFGLYQSALLLARNISHGAIKVFLFVKINFQMSQTIIRRIHHGNLITSDFCGPPVLQKSLFFPVDIDNIFAVFCVSKPSSKSIYTHIHMHLILCKLCTGGSMAEWSFHLV